MRLNKGESILCLLPTLQYDLAKGMTTIGDNVDGDGLMIVVFFETHGNHPDQNLRDGKFELNIASANCK